MRRTLRHQSAPAPRGRGRRTVAALAGAALLFGSATTAAMATGAGPEDSPSAADQSLEGEVQDPTLVVPESTGGDVGAPENESGTESEEALEAGDEGAEAAEGEGEGALGGGDITDEGALTADESDGNELSVSESLEPSGESEESNLEGEIESGESIVELQEAAPGVFAGADVPGCHYAPDGTGTYAGSLCWLSFPGLTTQVTKNANGTYTSPIGDQYISNVHEVVTNLETTQWNSDTSAWVTSKEVIRGFFGDITNYPVEIPLQGGLTLRAKLDVVGAAGNTLEDDAVNNANKWRSQVLKATQFPTYANSFLGNQIDGKDFYYPVEGSPALYQRGGNITRAQYNTATGNTGGEAIPTTQAKTTMTLKEISIVDASGKKVPDFAVVVADAESTDAQNGWPSSGYYQEYIKWNTDGAFTWLPNNQILTGTEKERYVGNACGYKTEPAFNATVATNAKDASCYAAVMNVKKTGTAMLAAHNPTYVKQEMLGGGLEGVAFGLMFATVESTVTVTDRIVDRSGQPQEGDFTSYADSDFLAAGAGVAATGDDASNNFATSDVAAMPVPPDGAQVSFGAPEKDDYTRSWVCTLTGRGTEALAQEFGDVESPDIAGWLTSEQGGPYVKVGEKLRCDVTYTPQYLTLIKVVDNSGTTANSVNTDWTLTATGDTSVFSGETGTKKPVAVGSYSLTEDGPEGYQWTDLVCTGGTAERIPSMGEPVTSATVSVEKGEDAVCTYTNKPAPGSLAIVKEFGSNVPAGTDGTFGGTYACELPRGGTATMATGTWSVDGEGTAELIADEGSLAPDALPKGASCTVTESTPDNGSLPNSSWVWVTPTDDGPQVVESEGTATVTVTNDAERVHGAFEITKAIDSDEFDENLTFGGDWVCVTPDEGEADVTGTWTVTGEGTWTSPTDSIPLGSTCTATESDPVSDGPLSEKPWIQWGDHTIAPADVNAAASAPDAKITVTNHTKWVLGSASWTKIDGDTSDGLKGSEWLLTGPDGFNDMELSEESCTGPNEDPSTAPYCKYIKDGTFEVGNLIWGDYVLKETKAPAGYVLDDEERRFTVDGTSLSVDVGNIENSQMEVPTLPNTGGMGSDTFLILGGVVILGSLGVLEVARRRNSARSSQA